MEMLMVCLVYIEQMVSWFKVFEWHHTNWDCHTLLEAHMHCGWLAAVHKKDTSG